MKWTIHFMQGPFKDPYARFSRKRKEEKSPPFHYHILTLPAASSLSTQHLFVWLNVTLYRLQAQKTLLIRFSPRPARYYSLWVSEDGGMRKMPQKRIGLLQLLGDKNKKLHCASPCHPSLRCCAPDLFECSIAEVHFTYWCLLSQWSTPHRSLLLNCVHSLEMWETFPSPPFAQKELSTPLW